MIEVIGREGFTKIVHVEHFPALDGYDIQTRALDYIASTDKDFRRAFVLEVLSYAKVDLNGVPIPLTTNALIDNHLETWQNVQKVFEGVLSENGIDLQEHANKPHFWANAGAEMATSFLANIQNLMGPAIEQAMKGQIEGA